MAAGAIELNDEFRRALDLLDGGANIFLTGKAGTGKSTLLRYFLDHTAKNVAVAAPTGIAALNVDGVTIHRLFSFPPSVSLEYVLGPDYYPAKYGKLLKELDTLVIDEVSMVRADLFDCVAAALARYGPRRGERFGGIQLVLVGDPYQLPPVVVEAEAEFFRTRYATPYFFSADAFTSLETSVVNLEKVYRQRDARFVDLLNEIRTGTAGDPIVAELNQRVRPGFETSEDEFWITLTTTNRRADAVNRDHLDRLPTPLESHRASSSGDLEGFEPQAPPDLQFKVGAQIMLVNNDVANRWVNGSLGMVMHVHRDDDAVAVKVALQDGETVTVKQHTWEVTKPVYGDGRLSYVKVGTYTQLPFKLAWAITIHKSQGKTLDKVVVDLFRGTFAEGQLYVALSRCTSLEGMVLKSPIKLRDVRVEREVTRFLARNSIASTAAESFAYLGVLATGYGEYDRIFELAAVIERDGEVIAEFSTLINPLRDIGRAASEYGVSASDLSLAPTVAQTWPVIARQLDGSVLACPGLPVVQTMIEKELKKAGRPVGLGLGLDLQELARLQGVEPILDGDTALERARAARALSTWLETDREVAVPYRPGAEGEHFGAIWSRDVCRLRIAEASPELAYSDVVTVVAASRHPSRDAVSRLALMRDQLRLEPEEVARVHIDAVQTLMECAQRDGSVSVDERERITAVCDLLDQPLPDFGEESAPASPEEVLVPGARVCFTGSALDASGRALEREDLEAMAVELGLVPVGAVTKTRCEALVAADVCSTSGKARKAREFGKPILAISQFLEWTDGRSGSAC